MAPKHLFLFLAALIVAPSMLAAQENLPETYVSPDERLTLRYPAGWVVQTDEGFIIIATSEQGFAFSGDVVLPSGEAVMAIAFSGSAELQEQDIFAGATANDIVNRVIDELASTEETGAFSAPSPYYLAGRSAARSEGSVAENDVVIIAMSMGGDVFGLVIGITAPGQLAKFEPKMVAIIESINYLPSTPAADLNALQTITPATANQLEPLWSVTPHTGVVYAVAISPDGSSIASCGADGVIFLLDAVNGEVIRTLSGHTSSVEQVLFSPDGSTLASLSSDGSFRLWDVATGEARRVFEHDEALFYMAFSPGGRWVAYSSYTQDPETFETVSSTVWLADAQNERQRSLTTLASGLFVNSVAFDPGSNLLLFSAADDRDPDGRQISVWLWDLERDQPIAAKTRDGNPVDVFFTPAGRPYASMNDIAQPNDLLVWDVEENDLQYRLTGFDDFTYHVVLNAEGTILGAASYDGTVRLWDMETGEALAVLEHSSSAYGVAFSDDGRLVATSDENGNVMLWGIRGESIVDRP